MIARLISEWGTFFGNFLFLQIEGLVEWWLQEPQYTFNCNLAGSYKYSTMGENGEIQWINSTVIQIKFQILFFLQWNDLLKGGNLK